MDSTAAAFQPSLGAALLGFTAGSILFGITLLQAYQYFRDYVRDSKWRKLLIAAVFLLDALNLIFSGIMIYSFICNEAVFSNSSHLWTLKGFSATKTFMILLVESYYLRLIWTIAGRLVLNYTLSKWIQYLSLLVFCYAVVIASVFTVYLETITSFYNFPNTFLKIVHVSFLSTAVIDCSIAVVISYLLFPETSGFFHSSRVVKTLISFFVGTGVITAIASIAIITLCAGNPSSVLYLAIDFSVPRLYANSILAMFNLKSSLQRKMQVSSQLKIQSVVLFGDHPDSSEVAP